MVSSLRALSRDQGDASLRRSNRRVGTLQLELGSHMSQSATSGDTVVAVATLFAKREVGKNVLLYSTERIISLPLLRSARTATTASLEAAGGLMPFAEAKGLLQLPPLHLSVRREANI